MASAQPPAIIVHGGAGVLSSDGSGHEWPELAGVRAAACTGFAILDRGGSALDAVEEAVRLLEDDPIYNAGTGACLTAAGDAELDASIMDGATLRCGAVAVVKDVKNPVSLARHLLEGKGHVFLAGPGASAFARSVGIPAHENTLLVTPRQLDRFRRAGASPPASTGTVGAVARDRLGHLAAATSTGGMAMKLPGRVGDTPLIGCGTYADDLSAAVSCTGHGERLIELTLARHCAYLASQGYNAMEAAQQSVCLLRDRVNGEGGLIVLTRCGGIGFAHNTPAMSRAYSRPDGTIEVAI